MSTTLSLKAFIALSLLTAIAIPAKSKAQTPSPAYCGIIYGVDSTTAASKIYTVNTTTAAYTNVGTARFFSAAAATQPSTGNLFYVSRNLAGGAQQIGIWNPITKTNTTLPSTFSTASGSYPIRAAFSANGRLFVATNLQVLIEVNPATGALISTNQITLPNGTILPGGNGDMAFDGAGALFYFSDANLYSIDIATYKAYLVASAPTGTQFNSLAFTPTGGLYGYAGSNNVLYSVNTNTGTISSLGSPSGFTVPSLVGTDLASCATPTPNVQPTKSFSRVGGGATIQPGDLIEYTIKIPNTGNVPATNAVFKDVIPTGTTYVAGSTTLNGVVVADGAGGSFPYTTGAPINSPTLKSGVVGTSALYEATLKFRVQVNTTNPPALISNQATLSFLGSPPGGIVTDDPSTPTPGDATITTITIPNQPPETNNISAPSQPNPGGTSVIQVPTLSGTDPEEGSLGSGKSFKIVQLPTNATLYYNNAIVTAGQILTNYNPAQLMIDPNDGALTASFTYAAIDSAGLEDPTPATVTMPFSAANAITCPTGSTATGSGYATGGIGQYLTKNSIYWLDWSCGAKTQFNPGDVITKTWTAPNGISVTATLSDITKPLESYTSGTYVGDRLQDLYEGPTSTGLINRNDAEDPSYKISFSMTLNGIPIPADIVSAEAESTDGENEFASWTTDGDPWQPLEAAANSSLKARFSNGGKTIYMEDNPDGGFGVLVALAQNVSNITVNMNAGGKEAIAFGIMIPFDYGDAPATYGAASHYTRRLASGGSQPTALTNVNSLTMATLSYNSPYLGAIGADPEQVYQSTANAEGDKLNGDNDEDALIPLPNIPASGTYALNNIRVNNTTGSPSTLYAWVDFNKNGVFEASEFTSTIVANNATTANLNWTIPSGTTPGTTYARFRLTTQALTDNPTTSAVDERAISVAADGEVEDYQATIAVASNPNVLLVKRITALNNSTMTNNGDNLAVYKDVSTNPYDDNVITTPTDTDRWPNPSSFLIGGTNGGNVRPGDELEYTIYFLSAGDSVANNVLFCDRVPSNVTFLPTAFNSFATQAAGGLPNSDRGIQWLYNNVQQALTNTGDGDVGRYFPPGDEPSKVYPNINCGGANTNGAIVVNLGNLPPATAPGTPNNAYGWVRFRGRVK